jgi:N-acetylmuramoyl-L-alanine amidase
MSYSHYLALAAASLLLPSCSLFNKGGEDYDTVDGGSDAGYDTSNPYGVPDVNSIDSVPYQPVNPPADHPTYSPAAYEDNTASAPAPTAAPAAATAASTTHTVVRGDTLGGIARRYGASSAAIKQANGMSSDTVVLGKQLVIPGSSGPVASAPATSGGKVHTVVKGDSLGRISNKYGVSIDALKKANGMNSDTVVLGSKLRIP